MRVKNRKCIRRLSFKSLWASRKRNIIAICAIALTTLMFTSLFTIMLSVNSSYETYNFRQAGGYSDGSFKDLSREQADKIAAHKGIKASGERIVCGFSSSDVFGKVAAEVSYMDKNCTKWSYATPTTGKEPQKENEIAMDTTALRLLGVEPKLGTNVTITYQAGNGTDTGIPQTDSFILVGYWEYDDLMPVHYINVSKAYVDKINEKCIAAGDEALDIDLNVMLPSKLNIREQMEKIDTDLGYDWNTRDQENSARIGVNWGLTASSVSSDIDFSLVAAILAFSLLIIFTGYLIIQYIPDFSDWGHQVLWPAKDNRYHPKTIKAHNHTGSSVFVYYRYSCRIASGLWHWCGFNSYCIRNHKYYRHKGCYQQLAAYFYRFCCICHYHCLFILQEARQNGCKGIAC